MLEWIQASDDRFLLVNKGEILSLGVNENIKVFLFDLYYEHYQKHHCFDKKIFNLLFLWNIELNIAPEATFVKNINLQDNLGELSPST